MSGRVVKGGERYYRKPKREKHPALDLPSVAVGLLKAAFPSDGDHPSVTTILSVLAKPALIGWAAKEERKMVSLIAGHLYGRLHDLVSEPPSPEKFAEMVDEEAGKPAQRRLLEKAASIGTEVHRRIEWTFKGELGLNRADNEPPLTTKSAIRSFERWVEWRASVNLRVVAIEKQLFSQLYGFGGTLDALVELGVDGKKVLATIDFKTGKKVYEESFLQNVAYRMALAEEGIQSDMGIIVRLPKYEQDPDFDAVTVPADKTETYKMVFIALAIVYRWWKKPEDEAWKAKKRAAAGQNAKVSEK